MNERFFSLPAEKQQTILNAGYRVFSQNSYKNSPMSEIADAAGISKLNPKQFIPGLDIPMMYREITKLINFWKSIYLRKEES